MSSQRVTSAGMSASIRSSCSLASSASSCWASQSAAASTRRSDGTELRLDFCSAARKTLAGSAESSEAGQWGHCSISAQPLMITCANGGGEALHVKTTVAALCNIMSQSGNSCKFVPSLLSSYSPHLSVVRAEGTTWWTPSTSQTKKLSDIQVFRMPWFHLTDSRTRPLGNTLHWTLMHPSSTMLADSWSPKSSSLAHCSRVKSTVAAASVRLKSKLANGNTSALMSRCCNKAVRIARALPAGMCGLRKRSTRCATRTFLSSSSATMFASQNQAIPPMASFTNSIAHLQRSAQRSSPKHLPPLPKRIWGKDTSNSRNAHR
mmetsp:Transcript_39957/g.109974  ORF Transcript_39957/g.109974 Transcript_39957/m.109974 type:complete len:320 (-) Transcript_39957:350-1309(-)